MREGGRRQSSSERTLPCRHAHRPASRLRPARPRSVRTACPFPLPPAVQSQLRREKKEGNPEVGEVFSRRLRVGGGGGSLRPLPGWLGLIRRWIARRVAMTRGRVCGLAAAGDGADWPQRGGGNGGERGGRRVHSESREKGATRWPGVRERSPTTPETQTATGTSIAPCCNAVSLTHDQHNHTRRGVFGEEEEEGERGFFLFFFFLLCNWYHFLLQ